MTPYTSAQPGASISGWFVPHNPWCTSFSAAVTQMKVANFKRVGIPIWDPFTNYDVKTAVSQAHDAGMAVHLVCHNSEPGEPILDPASFMGYTDRCLNGSGIGKGDSVEWANELDPAAWPHPGQPYNWEIIPPFYWGIGYQIHQLIKSLGAESVCNLPMDQAPGRVMDFLKGGMCPQTLLVCDSWGAHVYSQSLSSQLPTLQDQLDVLWALSKITQKPVRITEYGGTLKTPGGILTPDPTWYGGVASWCVKCNTWGLAWQWNGTNDGWTVGGQPGIISSIVNATSAVPSIT